MKSDYDICSNDISLNNKGGMNRSTIYNAITNDHYDNDNDHDNDSNDDDSNDNLNSPVRKDNEWSVQLDCYSTFNNDLLITPIKNGTIDTNNDTIDKPWHILRGLLEVPSLLILIGIITAIISYTIIVVVGYGNSLLIYIMSCVSIQFHLIIFCIWSVTMALISVLIVQNICEEAAGGGLPEMKAILSGMIKPILLSKRLIITKTIGLCAALLAGLSIGKEGPLVLIAAGLSDQLMKTKIFQHIRRQDNKRLEILACACAAGVSSSFGLAFSSLIFSIEFTSSSYLVKNLPKAFLTSVIGMLTLSFLFSGNHLAVFDNDNDKGTNNSKDTISIIEICVFIFVGVVCSLFGVGFVYLVDAISQFRNKLLDPVVYSKDIIRRRRVILVVVVTSIIAPFSYYEIINNGHISNTLRDVMFTAKADAYSFQSLVSWFFYKFLVTAFSVSLPIPCGLFSPVFLSGSLLGRAIGILLKASGFQSNYTLSEFAIIGSVSFSTGITRAISTALIVYELSGQRQIRFPLSITLLVSYFTSNRFSKNVYEVLIDTNRIPIVQELPREVTSVVVHEVMTPLNASDCISITSSFRDALDMIKSRKDDKMAIIPVVESKASMVLVGQILKEDIRKMLRKMKGNQDIESKALDKRIQFVVLVGTSVCPFKSLQSQLSVNTNSISPFKYSYEIDKDCDIFIDPSPYQIVYTSQLSKVDNVFRLLKLNHAFVTEAGRVVGVVTRENLRVFLGERQKHPTEKLKLLITSTMNLFKPSRHYTQIN